MVALVGPSGIYEVEIITVLHLLVFSLKISFKYQISISWCVKKVNFIFLKKGSGKSTCLQLIMRFHDTSSGTVVSRIEIVFTACFHTF